jgi:hypothetical protein
MPFQRLYVVHTPKLIQAIQNTANAGTFIPNLLDFGMLFSGLNKESQHILRGAFGLKGNSFTMSVHKYLLSGLFLKTATIAAVNRLSASLPNNIAETYQGGLLNLVRHELTLALTGAIYGPENPYEDPKIEVSWWYVSHNRVADPNNEIGLRRSSDFVPGISHLLYSPLPHITAHKALQARGRVMDAFRKYFETGGHLQAFPMVSEMYDSNKARGLSSREAAKMELATSLAMLSSGANTTFWLLFQIFSDYSALKAIRNELLAISTEDADSVTPQRRIMNLSFMKEDCPTLVAMLNETLRIHSTVINIKQVQHDIILADQYLLKKNAIVMIPGQSVHHDKDIWGSAANVFDYHRFLSSDSKKKLSSTSAFRPFGAGVTMCPGRHFSTNVILSLVAMIILQYDVMPLEGRWIAPKKRNADLWNAMPKPDCDIDVRFVERVDEKDVDWKFLWENDSATGN